jgi:cytidine deaminase
MKELKVTSTISIYDSLSEMTEEEAELLMLASEQMKKSYAPYSRFRVGAAVKLENGKIFPGCNQENASYPLCICGERVALFNAGAHFPNTEVNLLAIVASNEAFKIDKPVAPCGACRQVISEFEQKQDKPIRIMLMGDTEAIYVFNSAAELLPFGFDSSYLFGTKQGPK